MSRPPDSTQACTPYRFPDDSAIPRYPMTSLIMPPLAFQGQYGLPLSEIDEEINVDLFAGGGGASTGLEMGLGRPVHIAINHNPAAISMHQANHPGALDLQTDVWEVDPVQVLAGRRIGWFHASPDCTH